MNSIAQSLNHAINNDIAILIIKGNLKRRVFEGALKEVNENYIVLDINPTRAENEIPNLRAFGYDTFTLATELDIELYHLIKDILYVPLNNW